MKTLPDEILIKIIYFLEIKENHSICCTQKPYLQLGKGKLSEMIQDKKKWVSEWFPNIIFEMMNGQHNLIFAPVLPFQNHFIGIDYLDGITISDVTSPIMVGIDDCRRPFITIRTSEMDKEPIVTTIFQRYTNHPGTWTHGSCYYTNLIGDNSSRVINGESIQAETFRENIKNLLEGNNYIKYRKISFQEGEQFFQIPTVLC